MQASIPFRTFLLLPFAFCLALAACGERATWDQDIEAAQRAHLRRDFPEAERLYAAAVAKAEAFGPADARLGFSLNQLAKLYHAEGRFQEAQALYTRAVRIYETARGTDHPDVAATLNNLGALYRMHGQYADAEPHLQRALAIKERLQGPDSPDVAVTVRNLAALYAAQGFFDRAEPLYRRALEIRERAYGPDHPDVGQSLKDYALLLTKMGRQREAWAMLERVKVIEAKKVGAVLKPRPGAGRPPVAPRADQPPSEAVRAPAPVEPPTPEEALPPLQEVDGEDKDDEDAKDKED